MNHPSPVSLCAALVLAAIVLCFSPLHAATFNWTGGGTANSWGTANNFATTPTFNNQADLVFNVLTRGTNWLGANRSIRSMTFGADIDSSFIVNYQDFNGGAARTNTMDADLGNASINVLAGATGDITLGTAGGGGNFGFLALADDLDVVHNGSGLLLFNRGISNVSSAQGITKTGTGTMQFNSFNTFTGAININEGRLIANTFGALGQDLNAASAVNLRGGALQIGAAAGVAKTYDTVPFNVLSNSILAYNNTNAGTFTAQFTGANAFNLGANLLVQNISSNTANVNGLNLGRAITGAGNMSVETYNNITSSTNNYSLGRILLGGDNSAWSGDLNVARGTVSLGGSNLPSAGAGSIVIGSTDDSFGAGVTFFPTAANGSTVTFSNDLTVRTGGFRSIKGGGTDHSMVLSGDVVLEGNLNIDSTLSGGINARAIALGGSISGGGRLDITRSAGSTNTFVRLSGTNSYTGSTTVFSGSLIINGDNSAASGNVTVASGASLGGSGTIGGATTVDGSLRPGVGLGTLTVANDVTWNSGNAWVFELGTAGSTLASPGTSDFLAITGGNSFLKGTGSTFTFDFAGTGAEGWYKLAGWSGGSTTFETINFSGTNFSQNDFTTVFTLANEALYVEVIPEPSTIALLVLGFAALTGRTLLRRRRLRP